ncbi:phosphatase [Vibrio genomosp. F10]|uniref:phosphatase n=1 Tax=Vibrio genomosp. F10 TaxID=723171 RepID=UPI0002F30E83|nr:phosphatase [Vibrio genomosp. F10]OEE97332.1 phosphatase [Vibrio genomosp. F10 str. 9ZD137]OEF04470.1 phosphatase [Vibrio genomosp. F10 str. 9ZB36]
MKLCVDTHTHTYASGHAYSTLIENAKSAKENGLSLFCTTDHAESMPGAPHYWFFSNQRVLPRFLEGVGVLRGCEVNIINPQGEIDIPHSVDQNLDWVLASFHEPVFNPVDSQTHTTTLLNVIKNGRVDALGHLGNPNFDFDFDEVIQSAAKYNVAIEINNTSLTGNSRVGSIERCQEIARLAKHYGAYVTTGSDAHFCLDVGNLNLVSELLDTVQMDPAQVITRTPRQFLDFLELRGRPAIKEFSHL